MKGKPNWYERCNNHAWRMMRYQLDYHISRLESELQQLLSERWQRRLQAIYDCDGE